MPTIRERVIAEQGNTGFVDKELMRYWMAHGSLQEMVDMPEEELEASWAKWKLEIDNER